MDQERTPHSANTQPNPWDSLKNTASNFAPTEVASADATPATEAPRLPRYEGDPNQYSEAELMADPIKRFCVNPDDFRYFARQTQKTAVDRFFVKPLDENLGEYVACTADTIAVISGHDQGLRSAKRGEVYDTPADHVIYLDKSARPVCWLVNTFWNDFSDNPRPPHSFLAIDRADWLRRMGFTNDADGRDRETGDRITPAEFKDRLGQIDKKYLAGLHALFVPGGVETDDYDAIMQMPTVLDGKNVLVVDEVARSGSTQAIAKMLLEAAIPAIKQTQSYIFWRNPGSFVYYPKNGISENEIGSAPIWYDSTSIYGRGIGDPDEAFYAKRYAEHPNPKTRAQKLGSFALGAPLNLAAEPEQASRELAREIQNLHREYEQGHILMAMPQHYDLQAWQEQITQLGVKIVRRDRNAALPRNSLAYIKDALSQRPPAH